MLVCVYHESLVHVELSAGCAVVVFGIDGEAEEEFQMCLSVCAFVGICIHTQCHRDTPEFVCVCV